jgi:hypothetical protein
MIKKVTILLCFIFLLDLVALALFGKSYTTHLLIPPFVHSHDFVLSLIFGISLIFILKNKEEYRVKSVEILFGIAILYLMISVFKIRNSFNDQIYYVIRQFMVFGYAILMYVIIRQFYMFKDIQKQSLKAISIFGIVCLSIQFIYVFYFLIFKDKSLFFNRNYFTPIVVVGLFIAASYALTHIKNVYLKVLSFIGIFLLSFSTGHDSIYLSLAVIFGFYVFYHASKKMKIVSVIAIILLVVCVFVFIPSFSDVNMQWRLLYWGDVLNRVVANYFIVGDGFGVPYATDGGIEKLNSLMTSHGHDVQIIDDEKYVSAPHNSFLTMMIHVGFIPLLLLFFPFIKVCRNSVWLKDKDVMFLCLSLIAMFVFSAFNVVFELPHTSSIIWAVYFIFIFKLEEKREQQSTV